MDLIDIPLSADGGFLYTNALYFVATNKNGISEIALAKYIGVTLKTAWSAIHSDAFRFYNALSAEYESIMKKYIPGNKEKHLKWLHVMISNIKANIDGAYHGIGGTYLQRYLDEFCYRFNRRHTKRPLFERLLACSVWAPYKTVAEVCI